MSSKEIEAIINYQQFAVECVLKLVYLKVSFFKKELNGLAGENNKNNANDYTAEVGDDENLKQILEEKDSQIEELQDYLNSLKQDLDEQESNNSILKQQLDMYMNKVRQLEKHDLN